MKDHEPEAAMSASKRGGGGMRFNSIRLIPTYRARQAALGRP